MHHGHGDIRGALELVNPPVGMAISLAQAQRQCRFPQDADDELRDLVASATAYCEQEVYGNRQLLPATYDLPLSGWWCGRPCRGHCEAFLWGMGFGAGPWNRTHARTQRPCVPLRLPRPPLLSVASVSYFDRDGNAQTLDPALYDVLTPYSQPGEMTWHPLAVAPRLWHQKAWPITVRFTAGYQDAASIPALAVQALKLLVSHWFDNRDATGQPLEGADRLMALLEWGSYK